MKVDELAALINGKIINGGDREIRTGYCCDLLSHVMADAPQNCAWMTVLTHVNIIAVAGLANIGCIVIPEGIDVPDQTADKAAEENVSLVTTAMSSYEVSWRLHDALAES